MLGQPTYVRRPLMQPRRAARGPMFRLPKRPFVLRPRGVGQTPGSPSVSLLPTCASVDATSTLPQMLLTGGGSLAMLVGIIGAVASSDPGTKEDYAIAAAVGLGASLLGGIWAVATFNQNFLNPQCTGPGIAALGAASVNPNQATPPGVPAAGPGFSLPIAAAPVAVPAS